VEPLDPGDPELGLFDPGDPVPGVFDPGVPDEVFVWDDGELDAVEGVLLDGGCCGGLIGVVGVRPEAANAAAGATVRITGTLQPALSIVRREIPDRRSERSPSCDSRLPSDAPSLACLLISVLPLAATDPSA
jgi:hypothetical protein